jgi:nitroimidazol reductase NimA-like FMN-containing flavoprotein (pyridoxamine 5'-phosphate oxidase superfamily)
MRIKKSVANFLRWQRICRVATAGRNGVPHAVPVCHVFADDKLYFGSGGGAKKVENLRANPHVTVTVDIYADDWSLLKGVMVQGTALLIDSGPRFKKIVRLLYEKYPQYPEEAALGKGDVIVEVTPKHLFSWGLE